MNTTTEGLTMAQLAERNAEHVSTIESLEAKLAAMTAENAALKADVPLGAIENGRAFAERLETYPFECQGGDLRMCSDWQEFLRCFEYLSEWAMHSQSETPSTDAAIAEIQAQGVDKFAEDMSRTHAKAQSGGYFDRQVVIYDKIRSLAVIFAAQLRKEASNEQ